MPKVIQTKEARLAERVIKCLPSNNAVAKELGNTKQKQSYRTRCIYPELLYEAFKLLDLAGYEVKEKE